MRGLVFGVVGLVGCAPAKEDCPPGTLGCPCIEVDECNAGFECRSDVCRDDEDPTGTSTGTSTSTTAPSTTEPPLPPTTDMTSVGSVTTDPTIDPTATSGSGACVCGWSGADGAYACGFDLPAVGPVGKGSPTCLGAVPEDVMCDAVEPPVDAYGCCFGTGTFLVSCEEGTTAIGECMVVAPGMCEPV